MQLLNDLNELARSGVPITVANITPGIVVFNNDENNMKAATVWEAQGDPGGNDVKQVSPQFILNPNFREALLRKILEVQSTDEALDRAIANQTASWNTRQAARANATAAVLIKDVEQTVASAAACIVPKGRDGLCGSYALVNPNAEQATPPLCSEHQNLASQYTAVETGRTVRGRPEVLWKRAATTPVTSGRTVQTVTMLDS